MRLDETFEISLINVLNHTRSHCQSLAASVLKTSSMSEVIFRALSFILPQGTGLNSRDAADCLCKQTTDVLFYLRTCLEGLVIKMLNSGLCYHSHLLLARMQIC